MKFKNDVEIQNSDLIVGTDIYTTQETLKVQAGGTSGTYIQVNDLSSEVLSNGDIFANNLSGTNTGDQDLSNYVTTNTTQTISGAKTFSASQTIINGNLGIGTTSPDRKIHVVGGYYLKGGAGNTSYVADGLWGATATPNLLNSTMSGNIGLRIGYQDNGSGLYSPAYGFEVKSTDGIPVAGRVKRAIVIKDVDTGLYPFYINNNGSAFFDGDVGIGTTSPGAKLDIVGTGLATLFRVSNTEADATIKYGTFMGRHYNNSEENITGMLLTSSSSVTGGSVSIGGGISAANAVNEIKFYTAANNTTLTGTERMRINSAGNVGIGTTSPGAKLEISDTTLAETRITSYPTSGYSGQSNLWLRTGQYGNSMIALGHSISGTAATASAGISYNDYSSTMTIKTNYGDKLTINGSGTVRILGSGSAAILEIGMYGGKITSNYSTLETNSNFKINGSVIVGDPNAMPSSAYAGAMRYRVSGNNSYVDMCMQTGASAYTWVNIVQNQW